MPEKQTKIMVVDGSKVTRTVIARTLEEAMEGARVTAVATSCEALHHLKQESHFDLLTTALMLEDVDGLELTRRVRQSEKHRHIPVIVISGDADARLQAQMFAAGVTDFFDKSRGYAAFVEFLKTFLRRTGALLGQVLYVEDSVTEAMRVRRLMEQHGLTVAHVAGAGQALQRLQREPRAFDLVVTNALIEGEETGQGVVDAVRGRFHLSAAELPVMVLSGGEDPAVIARLLLAGANDVVTQPVMDELFMARLRSLVTLKHQGDSLERQGRELDELLTRDALTHLPLKRRVLTTARHWLAERPPLWMACLALYDFRAYNLAAGHGRGDEQLAAAARAMLRHVPDDGLLTRLGGTELCLVLAGRDQAQVLSLIDRLRRDVAGLDGSPLPLTVAAGVAGSGERPHVGLNGLLTQAHRAMAEAAPDGVRLAPAGRTAGTGPG
jgi:two-component system cell cycle response regulator